MPNLGELILVAVVGLFVLYLRSYVQEKGKNLATKEDFQKLLDQTRQLTSETEQIKARISHQLWDRQATITLKRDMYFRLLSAIGELKKALVEQKGLEVLRRTRDLADAKYALDLQAKRAESNTKFDQAVTELVRAANIAPLVIPDHAYAALERYVISVAEIPRGENVDIVVNLEQQLQALERTTLELIAEARKDLGIPQSTNPLTPKDVPL